MITRLVFLLSLLATTPAMAQAEPIPENVLNKDYVSCMGGQTASENRDRAQYCMCIRDNMKDWDLETYAKLAQQQSKMANPQDVPEKIQELARQCMLLVFQNSNPN